MVRTLSFFGIRPGTMVALVGGLKQLHAAASELRQPKSTRVLTGRDGAGNLRSEVRSTMVSAGKHGYRV